MNDRIRHPEFNSSRRIWRPGRTDMRLGDAVGNTVVVGAGMEAPEHLYVVEVIEAGSNGEVRLNAGPLGGRNPHVVSVVPANRRLDDYVTEQAGLTITRAMLTPKVQWSGLTTDKRALNWPVLIGGLLLALIAGHYAGAVAFAVVWVLSFIGFGVIPAPKMRGIQIHRVGNKLPYSNRHVAERLAEIPPTPPRDSLVVGAVSDPGRRFEAEQRVAGVKERYGALVGDVAYRIGHSALFDPAVEPTREFTLLLARWDDGARRLPTGEAVSLAREIELGFEAARANAETVGLSHLPETARPDARRALKAVELAGQAATDGEREAALAQVTRLLASIALYYLPEPAEVPRMMGGSPPQVEAGP